MILNGTFCSFRWFLMVPTDIAGSENIPPQAWTETQEMARNSKKWQEQQADLPVVRCGGDRLGGRETGRPLGMLQIDAIKSGLPARGSGPVISPARPGCSGCNTKSAVISPGAALHCRTCKTKKHRKIHVFAGFCRPWDRGRHCKTIRNNGDDFSGPGIGGISRHHRASPPGISGRTCKTGDNRTIPRRGDREPFLVRFG